MHHLLNYIQVHGDINPSCVLWTSIYTRVRPCYLDSCGLIRCGQADSSDRLSRQRPTGYVRSAYVSFRDSSRERVSRDGFPSTGSTSLTMGQSPINITNSFTLVRVQQVSCRIRPDRCVNGLDSAPDRCCSAAGHGPYWPKQDSHRLCPLGLVRRAYSSGLCTFADVLNQRE